MAGGEEAEYPRTDSRYLTGDMEDGLPELVQAVSGAFLFTSGVDHPVHAAQVIDDEKVSDHHAILPTLNVAHTDLTSLSAGQRDVLQLIAVRLLAAVGDPHEYEDTVVTVSCEGTDFTAHEKKVTQMGWKIPEALFQGSLAVRGGGEKEKASPRMPELKEGQELRPVMAAVKEGKTTSPAHYTEGSLLAAMETAGVEDMPEDAERRGLGTPATRAGIIESLIRDKQLERKGSGKTKFLIPTELGKGLIAVVSEKLKTPALTAEWEQRLKAIEEGREDPKAFLKEVTEMLDELYQHEQPKPDMESFFHVNYLIIGACPNCGTLVRDLYGNVENYDIFMEAIRRSSPVPMDIVPLSPEEHGDGYFSLKENHTYIRAGMSQVQTVSAAIHEMSHSMLHTKEALEAEKLKDPEAKPKTKAQIEVEAESVSYACCQYYGIETKENSFGYI